MDDFINKFCKSFDKNIVVKFAGEMGRFVTEGIIEIYNTFIPSQEEKPDVKSEDKNPKS